MRVNIGLAQMYPKLGDVQANLDSHLQFIEQAKAKDVDLLIFPELSMTGYQIQDLVPEVALTTHSTHPIFGQLMAASEDVDLMVGFVHEDARNRFYIASAYLSRGKVLHIHHKLYLPTYGMFDESRFLAQGNSVRAFDTRLGRVGMLICEDFWHMSPPYILWMDGADMLLMHSASPGRGLDSENELSGTRWVERVNRAYGGVFTTYIAHVNRVGYEDGKVFAGGGFIIDPDGEMIVRGDYFKEQLVTHEVDLNQLHRTRARLPVLRDERPGLMRRELGRILDERLKD
ncbi:MAG: nitrilase-related carbon-nitrogen hydrolase [Anaerolineae bacterium]|nr:nitrilase-related carbon-nitrogen hydrolase [Anaerolineae bacterium]